MDRRKKTIFRKLLAWALVFTMAIPWNVMAQDQTSAVQNSESSEPSNDTENGINEDDIISFLQEEENRIEENGATGTVFSASDVTELADTPDDLIKANSADDEMYCVKFYEDAPDPVTGEYSGNPIYTAENVKSETAFSEVLQQLKEDESGASYVDAAWETVDSEGETYIDIDESAKITSDLNVWVRSYTVKFYEDAPDSETGEYSDAPIYTVKVKSGTAFSEALKEFKEDKSASPYADAVWETISSDGTYIDVDETVKITSDFNVWVHSYSVRFFKTAPDSEADTDDLLYTAKVKSGTVFSEVLKQFESSDEADEQYADAIWKTTSTDENGGIMVQETEKITSDLDVWFSSCAYHVRFFIDVPDSNIDPNPETGEYSSNLLYTAKAEPGTTFSEALKEFKEDESAAPYRYSVWETTDHMDVEETAEITSDLNVWVRSYSVQFFKTAPDSETDENSDNLLYTAEVKSGTEFSEVRKEFESNVTDSQYIDTIWETKDEYKNIIIDETEKILSDLNVWICPDTYLVRFYDAPVTGTDDASEHLLYTLGVKSGTTFSDAVKELESDTDMAQYADADWYTKASDESAENDIKMDKTAQITEDLNVWLGSYTVRFYVDDVQDGEYYVTDHSETNSETTLADIIEQWGKESNYECRRVEGTVKDTDNIVKDIDVYYYTDLQVAIDSVPEGSSASDNTIQLLKDIEINSKSSTTKFIIDRSLTLDFNGHTLNYNISISYGNVETKTPIQIAEGADVVLTGTDGVTGTVSSVKVTNNDTLAKNYNYYGIKNEGNLTIQGSLRLARIYQAGGTLLLNAELKDLTDITVKDGAVVTIGPEFETTTNFTFTLGTYYWNFKASTKDTRLDNLKNEIVESVKIADVLAGADIDTLLTKATIGYWNSAKYNYNTTLGIVKNLDGNLAISKKKDAVDIYVDGVNGDDDNYANTSVDAPVRTYAGILNAIKAAGGNVTKIYVINAFEWSDAVDSGSETLPKNTKILRYKTNQGALINVTTGTLTLSDIEIDGKGYDENGDESPTDASDAMIHVESGAALVIEGKTTLKNNCHTTISSKGYTGGGGAIYSEGNVTMNGGTISGNKSWYGGGIEMSGSGASLVMAGGSITGNTVEWTSDDSGDAALGGGVLLYNGARMTMTGGTISNNTGAAYGGGICIGSNRAVHNDGSSLAMSGDSLIYSNSASICGGGIYVQCDTTAVISAGNIIGNSCNGNGGANGGAYGGGGIYVNGGQGDYADGKLTMYNAVITGNTASLSGGGLAGCGTSSTMIESNGAAIYGNSAGFESAQDIYIDYTQSGGLLTTGKVSVSIAKYMLGGYPGLWKENGEWVSDNRLNANSTNVLESELHLNNNSSDEARTVAKGQASVYITGNSSGQRGGGVGSNGTVHIIATDPIPLTNLKITKQVKGETTDTAETDAATEDTRKTFTISVQLKDGYDEVLQYVDVQRSTGAEESFVPESASWDETGTATFTIKDGETIWFKNLMIGTQYTVEETEIPSGYHPQITVTPSTSAKTEESLTENGESSKVSGVIGVKTTTVAIENTYKASGYWDPKATKTLTGRDMDEGEFKFTLTETTETEASAGEESQESGAYSDTVTNTAAENGKAAEIIFHQISYSEADVGKHTYVMKEERIDTRTGVTSDPRSYTITVKVTDQKDGTLNVEVVKIETSANGKTSTRTGDKAKSAVPAFVNTYTASGSWTPTAVKTLIGRDMAAGEFHFSLTEIAAAEESNASEKVPSVEESNASEEVPSVEENDASEEVSAAEEGNASEEVPSAEESNASKTSVSEKGTTKEPEVTSRTAENAAAADGEPAAVTFDTISYSLKDVGQHTYVMTEDQSDLPDDVTGDTHSYIITVEVTDQKDGTLKAEVIKSETTDENGQTTEAEPAFVNNYQPEEPETQTESVTEKEPETQTEPVTEKEPETQTEPVTEKETEQQTELVTEKEPETQTEPVTEKESEPQTEPVTEKETEPQTELVTEKETEPQTEPVTEKEPEAQTESVTEKETERQTEPETEPDITVVFDKVKAGTKKSLAGAVLRVVDEDGTNIDEWTTDGNSHSITGKLHQGKTYRLIEVSAPHGYHIAADITFTAEDGLHIQMEDEKLSVIPKKTQGSISVTKKLTSSGNAVGARNHTFYVALFDDEACTSRATDIVPVTFVNASSSTVTFDELADGQTYYVGETNENGDVIWTGTVADDTIFVVRFSEGNEVTVQAGQDVEATFENQLYEIPAYEFYLEGSLTITKQLLAADGSEKESSEVFYAGIFDDPEYTQLSENVTVNIVPLELNGASSASAEVKVAMNDQKEQTLYVTEVDEDGVPVDETDFAYEVSIDGSTVSLNFSDTIAVTIITNQELPEETELVTEPETEPATEYVTEPETESETESETKQEVDPRTEPETEPESETEPATELVTESETESATELVTGAETESITELVTIPETESQTVRQTEKQTEKGIETTVRTGDDTPVTRYIILFAAAVVLLGASLLYIRRRRRRS